MESDINRDEIIDNFKRSTMIDEGDGVLSSELADKKRILTLINSLDLLGIRNSPDLSLRLNVLDTLWDELETKAKGEITTDVNNIKTQMVTPSVIYSRAIFKDKAPKPKNYNILFNLIKKYSSILRKESHKQLNTKE